METEVIGKKVDALKCLEEIKISLKLPENASKIDLNSYNELIEGNLEGNIDKIYTVIDAIERGCGVPKDKDVGAIIEEAFANSPQDLIGILTSKSILEQIILIYNFSEKVRNGIIGEETNDNMQILYECLRQTIKSDNWTSQDKSVFLKGILKLSESDSQFWPRWVEKREHDKRWIELLPDVFPKLGTKALVSYVETIHLGILAENNKSLTNCFCSFTDDCLKQIDDSVYDILYKRWSGYIDSLKKENEPQSDILISAYAGLIEIATGIHCENSKGWNIEIKKAITRLEIDMNDWYRTIVQMKSVFFLDCTQILILLCAKNSFGYIIEKESEQIIDGLIEILRKYKYWFFHSKQDQYDYLESLLDYKNEKNKI